jgi:hypothetical protein
MRIGFETLHSVQGDSLVDYSEVSNSVALATSDEKEVDRARIELATHGFSGRCSTD